MAFQRACSLDELSADEALAVTVGRYDLAIAHCPGADGDLEVFALQDLCSHAAVALSEGEVTECALECWLHGSTFDLRSGKPTGLPATVPVSTFPVEIRDADDGSKAVYVDVDTTLNGVTPS